MATPDLSEIKPGWGIGDLMLGSGGERVTEQLGAPERCETTDTGDPQFEHRFYDSKKLVIVLNLTIDRVVSITTWSASAQLWGESIVHRSRRATTEILAAHGIDLADGRASDDDLSEAQIEFIERGLAIQFDQARLRFVSVRPIAIDDRILWPSKG